MSNPEDNKPEQPVQDPVVDPTGTFVNYSELERTGLLDGLPKSLSKADFIPPPALDDQANLIFKPNPHVKVVKSVYNKQAAFTGLEPLYTLTGVQSEFLGALNHYDLQTQRKNQKWSDEHAYKTYSAGQDAVPLDYGVRAQWREGSQWTNEPRLAGLDCAPTGSMSGKGLSTMVQKESEGYRLGIPVAFPLWHSGFWITIRTPTARMFSNLDTTVASEKNLLGRLTNGALFGNTRAYVESAILDLLGDCITNTNVAGWTIPLIRDLIDHRDIQTVALMLGASRYPHGYPNEEPCTNFHNGCKNVRESSLSLINTLFVDLSYFSNEDIRHMSQKAVTLDINTIREYQKKARWNQPRVVKVTDSISVRLKHPSAVESIASGLAWAQEIHQEMMKALGDNSTTRRRNNYIAEQMEAVTLRTFAAYIDDIIKDDVENKASVEDVIDLFDTIGDDEYLTRRFEMNVREFEDSDIIAMMALPRHLCNECEGKWKVKSPDMLNEYYKGPILSPQDAVARLFTLRSLAK